MTPAELVGVAVCPASASTEGKPQGEQYRVAELGVRGVPQDRDEQLPAGPPYHRQGGADRERSRQQSEGDPWSSGDSNGDRQCICHGQQPCVEEPGPARANKDGQCALAAASISSG